VSRPPKSPPSELLSAQAGEELRAETLGDSIT